MGLATPNKKAGALAGEARLELATPGFGDRCSSQLSYTPNAAPYCRNICADASGMIPVESLARFRPDRPGASGLSPARRSIAVQLREALGLGKIVGRIDVEERVERPDRPRGGREAVTGGPAIDLAAILDGKRVAQVFPQCDAP
jgi:hypothetical protein